MTDKRNGTYGRSAARERSSRSRTPARRGEQPPTWAQFPPSVLGSLIIRLEQLGYAPLFGRTSDGGRLTLSLYCDGVRQSLYLGRSATTETLLADVGDVVGVMVSPPQPVIALREAPKEPLAYLDWMRAMKMSEKQIEASCRANGREYIPPSPTV